MIRVDRFFFFPPGKLIAKIKTKLVKNDVSNRIKNFDDSIMTMLNLDDSEIFRGTEEKSENSNPEEFAILRIAPYRHGSLERLPNSLRPVGCPKDQNGSLTLTMPLGSSFMVDGKVRVTVNEIKRGRIKLHVNAPLTTPVVRENKGAPK